MAISSSWLTIDGRRRKRTPNTDVFSSRPGMSICLQVTKRIREEGIAPRAETSGEEEQEEEELLPLDVKPLKKSACERFFSGATFSSAGSELSNAEVFPTNVCFFFLL